MNPLAASTLEINRRAFLCRAGASVGTAALASLLDPWSVDAAAAAKKKIVPADKWKGVVNQIGRAHV